jgi:hypothetical protein
MYNHAAWFYALQGPKKHVQEDKKNRHEIDEGYLASSERNTANSI